MANATVTQISAAPDIRKKVLENRHWSAHVKDVAHTRASESYDKWGRLLGLAVVISTTIVGTSAVASLAEDSPSIGAKVAVGALSALAALFAAVKEYAGYEKIAKEHSSTAHRFRELRYRAEELLVALQRGGSDKDIQAGIANLDAKMNQIEEPPLSKDGYTEAEAWVREQARTRTAGGAAEHPTWSSPDYS